MCNGNKQRSRQFDTIVRSPATTLHETTTPNGFYRLFVQRDRESHACRNATVKFTVAHSGDVWGEENEEIFSKNHSKPSHKDRNSAIRSVASKKRSRGARNIARVVAFDEQDGSAVIEAAHTQPPRQDELPVRCTHQTHPVIFKPMIKYNATTNNTTQSNSETNSETKRTISARIQTRFTMQFCRFTH